MASIRARRNVRVHTSDPVSDERLTRNAEAGRRAPWASNRQYWDFVIVADRQQLAETATVWHAAGHSAGAAAGAICSGSATPPTGRCGPSATTAAVIHGPRVAWRLHVSCVGDLETLSVGSLVVVQHRHVRWFEYPANLNHGFVSTRHTRVDRTPPGPFDGFLP
ncbi:Nitroreductase family protein [Asanoa ishikariensis]|uniref:Nitroreductase family protein n=1 Tax=Asanoa ishikariensis TaxID=137265 RepID=A0A1H3URZ8_9ACTN|nr:Nitroreductase family protein [Asanoa ishikariensis]